MSQKQITYLENEKMEKEAAKHKRNKTIAISSAISALLLAGGLPLLSFAQFSDITPMPSPSASILADEDIGGGEELPLENFLVDKSIDKTVVVPGDVVEYKIEITNISPDNIPITISDEADDGISLVKKASGDGYVGVEDEDDLASFFTVSDDYDASDFTISLEDNTLTFTDVEIIPDSPLVIEYNMQVSDDVENDTQIFNTVTVSDESEEETDSEYILVYEQEGDPLLSISQQQEWVKHNPPSKDKTSFATPPSSSYGDDVIPSDPASSGDAYINEGAPHVIALGYEDNLLDYYKNVVSKLPTASKEAIEKELKDDYDIDDPTDDSQFSDAKDLGPVFYFSFQDQEKSALYPMLNIVMDGHKLSYVSEKKASDKPNHFFTLEADNIAFVDGKASSGIQDTLDNLSKKMTTDNISVGMVITYSESAYTTTYPDTADLIAGNPDSSTIAYTKEDEKVGNDTLDVREYDIVKFYVDIVNIGDGAARAFTVSETFPTNFSFDSEGMSPAETNPLKDVYYEVSGETITWHVLTLNPYESKRLTFNAIVADTEEDVIWDNVAEVKYNTSSDTEIRSSNILSMKQGAPNISFDFAIEKDGDSSSKTSTDDITITEETDINYYITIKNTGTEAAEDIFIMSMLPTGSTYKNGSITNDGVVEDGVAQWRIEKLEPESEPIELKMTITIEDIDEEFPLLDGENIAWYANMVSYLFYNDPAAFTTSGPLNTKSHPSSILNVKQGFPLLTIKVEQKHPVADTYSTDRLLLSGSKEIDYRIIVSNDGSENVIKPVVKNNIPEKSILNEESLEGAEFSDNIITWKPDTLKPGEQQELTYTVKTEPVSQNYSWLNSASGNFDNNPHEEDTVSNEVETYTEFGTAYVELYQSPTTNFEDATQEEMQVKAGDKFTYMAVVSNDSDTSISDILVNIAVPEGLTINGRDAIHPNMASGDVSLNYTVGKNDVEWEILYLDAGKSTDPLMITVDVPDTTDAQNYEAVMNISYSPMPEDGPKESNKVRAYIANSELHVIKEAAVVSGGTAGKASADPVNVSAGDTVRYFITLDNTEGLADADGITVSDTYDSALPPVAGTITEGGTDKDGTITWSFDKIAQGASKQVSFDVVVPDNADTKAWNNTADVVYTNNPKGADAVIQSNTSIITQGSANITIEKLQSLTTASSFTKKVVGLKGNEDIYYQINLVNDGGDLAKDVVVVDNVPAGITIDETSIKDGSVEGHTITWTIGDFKVNDTKTLTFKGNVGEVNADTIYKNSASVSYSNNTQPESELTSNETIASSAAGIVNVDIKQSLSGAMTDDVLYGVADGNTINYAITVSNDGTDVVDTADITATIEGNLTVNTSSISNSGTYDESTNTITWTVSNMAVGSTTELRFNAKAKVETGEEEYSVVASSNYRGLPSEDKVVSTVQAGEGQVSKVALYLAIQKAQETMDKYPVSDTGKGLDEGTEYVTTAAQKKLSNTITDAKSIYSAPNVDQSLVDETLLNLNNALTEFLAGVQKAKAPIIAQDPSLSASIPSTLSGSAAKSYAVSYNGDGTISVKSSNTAVLEASYNKADNKIVLTPKKTGSATITLSASATESYNAISKKYNVKVTVTTASNTNKNTNTTTNKNTSTNKNTNTSTSNKNANANKNNANTNPPKPNVNMDTSKVKLPFTDTPANAWYYPAVQWAYANNLLTGYAGTTLFGSNDNLTRAQAAVILWRWFEPEAAASYVERNGKNNTPFTDNLNGKYYTGAINWAYSQGVLTGYEGTNSIGPNDPLTRQQMSAVMYRCATQLGGSSSNYSIAKYNAFPDKNEVASYAQTALAWCVDKGVISGWDGKYLAPTMTIDRVQMAQIMMNAVTKGVIK